MYLRTLSKLKKIACLVGSCAAAAASAVSAPAVPNLCTAQEVVVFSCSSRAKTVSLCRSPDLTPERGYMQYRFGTQGKAIEMQYPDTNIHPAKTMVAWEEGAAKWSLNYLRFFKGKFEYLLFIQRAAFDANGGGVLVKKSGRKVGQLVCPRAQIEDNFHGLSFFGLEVPPVEYLQYQEDVSAALSSAGIRE